jgi:putative transposase
MSEAGLKGCMRGRRTRGTTRRVQRSAAEDLLKRDFVATEVDKVWVADITYVHTAEGFLYLPHSGSHLGASYRRWRLHCAGR